MVYFCAAAAAHGSHVPRNKMPFMCVLCLIGAAKTAHAYVMCVCVGGLTILRYFFFLFDVAIHLPAGGK